MQQFISFIKSKLFFKHISLALAAMCAVFFLSFKLLNIYSGHGVTVITPDFKGQSIYALNDFIKEKGVNYKIIDSIFDPLGKPGIVLNQDPTENTKVKPNRVIYLYTNATVPPTIEMPQFAGRSLSYSLTLLKSYGLKQGIISFEPGYENLVLKQIVNGRTYTDEEIKNAKTISLKNKSKQPFMIRKGSTVDLIVGRSETVVVDSTKSE